MPLRLSSKRPRSIDSDEEEELISWPVGKVSPDSVRILVHHADFNRYRNNAHCHSAYHLPPPLDGSSHKSRSLRALTRFLPLSLRWSRRMRMSRKMNLSQVCLPSTSRSRAVQAALHPLKPTPQKVIPWTRPRCLHHHTEGGKSRT
jgi:hypothetical protein